MRPNGVTNYLSIAGKNCIEITVEFKPNIFQVLFGMKKKEKTFTWIGETYIYGGNKVWYNKKTGEEIDRHEETNLYNLLNNKARLQEEITPNSKA